MSQQHGGSLPNNTPVFRRPLNLDMTLDVALPSERELLSPQATMRECTYVVCLEENGQAGVPTEEKEFVAEFFGNLEGLGKEMNHTFYPLTFDDFIEMIHEQLGADVPRYLTVWATAGLDLPAVRVSTDQQVSGAIFDHFDMFQKYPLECAVLYFFVEFGRSSDNVPPASRFHENFDVPFVPDNLEGGVSPSHIPAAPTGPYVTSHNEPVTVAPVTESPATESPAQPKRTNTFNKMTIAVKNAAGVVKDLVSPRGPAEQHTVLTDLASGIEEVDYLTNLLATTDRDIDEDQAAISHEQARLFKRFARFFPHIDAKKHENERYIHVRYSSLAVTPHQFCRAMQILFQDDTTGFAGGLLCSEMGSGKSFIVLASVAIRALLFESQRRVLREWEEVEKRTGSSKKGSSSRQAQRPEHLPRDAPKGQRLACPTQRHRPEDVVCFCVPDGATRNELPRLKPGAALIHVPSAAMPGWIDILEGALFSRIAYNVTVLYNGPRLSSRLEPSPDFLGGTRFNRWQMSAKLPAGHPGGLITDSEDLEWFAEPAPLSDRSLCLETYIIVTPHSSTKLRDLFSWELRDFSQAPQNCQFPSGGLYALPVGITFIDEAHKVLEENSMPLQLAREHRHVRATPSDTRPSDVWLVTGTPFGAQLKHLAAAVSLIAPQRTGDARALHATYEAIAPAMTNSPRAAFEKLFDNVFSGNLVIRDDPDTTWLGFRVSDTRNVRPQYVSRNTPESQLHAVRMVIDTKVSKGPRDAYFDALLSMKQNTELLYLLSMFPSAAKLLLETPDLVFTDLDTRRTIRKQSNTTGESLTSHKYFRSLAEKLNRAPRSPKLQFILDDLERMAKDKTPRPQPRGGASANVQLDLTLKKVVIITPTLLTALMLYMILARYHLRSGPLLYHEDLKQSQRQDVLRRFNSLRKRDGPTRVFIAPASVASEALNLQIANRLILTSPLLDVHQQNQALARVNRAGQCFDVELRVLLLEDSPIDRIIVAHRAGAKLENDPFNVDESVSVVYDE